MCEIQTDKATVGFECQEEGFLGKILQPEGAVCPINSLIGVLVEEEEDIGELDIAELKKLAGTGAAAVEDSTPEPKKEEAKPAASSSQPAESEDYDAEFKVELSSGHISPAAAFHMRVNHLLPHDIKSTGPKGYITKGDVLNEIALHGPGPRSGKTAAPQKSEKKVEAAPAKKPAAKKPAAKAPPKAASPVSSQHWTDIPVTQSQIEVAEAVFNSKRYIAHAYMSAVADVTAI